MAVIVAPEIGALLAVILPTISEVVSWALAKKARLAKTRTLKILLIQIRIAVKFAANIVKKS
jgi:hypothetical protein